MDNRLAIIVPYRNREENLKEFIPNIKQHLNGIDYTIIIVEQFDDELFNRARLLNIGFLYVYNYVDYVCFHDVDMLPIEADYSYPQEPIHMATNTSQFGNNLPYQGYYGGVNLFNVVDFININGYSNEFWGWGGEDDDLLKRVLNKGYRLTRRKGVYKSIENTPGHLKNNHKNYKSNVDRLSKQYDFNTDGLNTLKWELLGEFYIEDNVILMKVI